MSEELNLVTELAIILIAAGVFTVISKALKQPLILGYIVAGFIVGPNLGLFPQFSPGSVHVWSELGIIFLLFGLGLEFNFKKLLGVGSSAIIAALTICFGMFMTGLLTGAVLGWGNLESTFLGGMMSMSSTTIIIKAYDDLGMKNAPHATLVFGLLVVEDLLAVLMMVLFSTLAVSNQFSGVDMLLSLGKLVVFLVLCFLVGIWVLPTLLKKARNYISDEILLLISVGLCFLMVILANKAGFSSALGAFLMGSILSSTIEGERIEHITINLKNLFGAVFFVSVGMMVDPAVIGQHWGVILVITLVAMTGILVFSTTGVLLSGKNLDTALKVGFSLPQLGEFSFIIAGLGCSLGVLRDFIYPVIISVSVITTFTTPYMIKAATPVSAWLHKKLSPRILSVLNRRDQLSEHTNKAEENLWKTLVKKLLIRISIYGIILFVIILGAKAYLPLAFGKIFPNMAHWLVKSLEILITLCVMVPFLGGIAFNGKNLKEYAATLAKKDPRAKIPLLGIIFFRIFLAITFVSSAIMSFAEIGGWFLFIIYVLLVLLFVLMRMRKLKFTRLEDKFFRNLNEKEELGRSRAPVSSLIRSKMEGYDVHIRHFTVSQDFALIGNTLREMPFRHKSGVNIVKIQRGSRSILIPGGNEVIYPGDVLVIVGTESQLDSFETLMKAQTAPAAQSDEDFNVENIILGAEAELVGRRLSDTNMRAAGCMVVSVERSGVLHTNPGKDFVFEEGDSVWLAGLQSSIDWYKK